MKKYLIILNIAIVACMLALAACGEEELTPEEQTHVVRSIASYFGMQLPAATLRGPKWLKAS